MQSGYNGTCRLSWLGSVVLLCVAGCTTGTQAIRPADMPESTVVPVQRPARDVSKLKAALASADAGERAAAAWEIAGATEVTPAVLEQVFEASQSDSAEAVREAASWAYSHLEARSGPGNRSRAYDEAPVAVETPTPRPPTDPRAHRRGGDVVVEILISARGEVVHAEVRQSTVGLDEPALDCARSWKFKPARLKGNVVPCVALVTVRFQALR